MCFNDWEGGVRRVWRSCREYEGLFVRDVGLEGRRNGINNFFNFINIDFDDF